MRNDGLVCVVFNELFICQLLLYTLLLIIIIAVS